MFKCPFLPCMDCPYSMCPQMSQDNKMSNMPIVPIKEETEEAYIRVLHASPDAPPVDIYIDGKKAIDNLAYGMMAGYVSIEAGERKIEVFPAGSTKNPVISAKVPLDADTFTTIAAVGKLANIEPLVLMDYDTMVPKNSSLIRFVHMSPNAPAVDITLPDGKKLFSNVGFKQVTDYISVNPGNYTLQVRLPGTNTVVLTLPNIKLEGGVPYSVYAIGLAGGMPPLTAVIVEDMM